MTGALVTGGGRGIGAAVVRRIAAEGVPVAVLDRDGAAASAVAAEITGTGGRALAIEVDVAKADRAAEAVETAAEWAGGLAFAYNNAGVTGIRAETADYPEDVFWRVQYVNVGGVLSCLRAELRLMLAGGGAIVNAASGAAVAGVPGSSAYAASKHAIAGLTRTAAVEYASRGIRVNAVAPGLVRTGLVRDLDDFEAAHPAGRAAEPEEVAEAVWWLLNASYVTGVLLPVDGGLLARVPGLS
ncbi:NAD(P)-dependent dehydrogenase (short-subunit alcohol dehydrogenase family) [Amycolatopsis bartoniae]|uniref:Short-chain dehydrogenase n=1 Tax=Amycolatopsis bartoniae TaxID=941986 RepID=A0A8H9IX65_9PSEU|nr:SDR family oxidoreductase [Amycolatopsis bartoniae]MBB2937883.1 NAD(P)-dependent dehydrogenase (short-subunit alcohol dehydrogenase family) [Amycolatopsis bartoniae]TVT01309.1 SDR family oxidoreductase [Amycolatopsis bartoniae]GHF41442.1 short-chain dehydrogenase [Amycolatopsis bartoniae]